MSTELIRPWEVRRAMAEQQTNQREALKQARNAEREVEGCKLLPEGCKSLHEAVLKYEADLIKAALEFEGKSVTRAAKWLGTSYQGLAYAIEMRHPQLKECRTKRVSRQAKVLRIA